jgi:hypothetical protein
MGKTMVLSPSADTASAAKSDIEMPNFDARAETQLF